MRFLLFACAAIVAAASPAAAQVLHDVTADPVHFDRWMYPFNGTPGIRNLAPTFGAASNAPDFDNRDGQFVVWVNTVTLGIPAGQGVANYLPVSVRVTATHFEGDFTYDPSYDAWQTYLPASDPLHVADSDSGRPIELYGVGARNGYTLVAASSGPAGPPGFEENERHCEGCGSMGQGVRNIFAYDPGAADPQGDVSNNVRRLPPLTGGGFDTFPWAIGKSTSGLLPGATVPEGSAGSFAGETFTFDVDVSDPDVAAYVKQGLNNGVLGFTITSMHDVVQQVGGTNPNFYTTESFEPGGLPPSMEIVAYVPEPGAAASLLAGCAALAFIDRRRSRRR
jgi:hypothetical protein